jgi:hypothetical protein
MFWQPAGLACQGDTKTIAHFLADRRATNAVDLSIIPNSWAGHESFPVGLAAVNTDKARLKFRIGAKRPRASSTAFCA